MTKPVPVNELERIAIEEAAKAYRAPKFMQPRLMKSRQRDRDEADAQAAEGPQVKDSNG